MLEYIGLVLILSAILAIFMFRKPKPQHICETCKYYGCNCTQGPCMTCEGGSEWQENDMDKQEGFD